MIRSLGRFPMAAAVAIAVVTTGTSCSRSPTGPNYNTWRFLPGTVERLSVPAFRDGRQCWIYLPPGYAMTNRRFPVLYFNDGEIAFDGPQGMRLNRACEDLIRRGEMEPIIVVAIENGPGRQRYVDLSPWPAPYLAPNGGGDLYVRAIRDTLKPEVDRRYRTLADSPNTAIGGVSLGGLLSAYAGFAYDSTFGKVAAHAPPYWWAADSMLGLARSRPRPRFLVRFYQDSGYPRDNRIDEMAGIAIEKGFVLGLDFMSLTVDGAEHDGTAFEHRFPQMLRFLFQPPS